MKNRIAKELISGEIQFPESAEIKSQRENQNEPEELFRLIKSNELSLGALLNAIEECGKTKLPQAKEILIDLLSNHESPVVRESAIYGLEYFGNEDDIYQILLKHSISDFESSPGVRWAAIETLNFLREDE